jgi:hypothetical protein
MTEAEWQTCTDPRDMFDHVKRQARSQRVAMPQRQLRLFSCACCRVVWHLLNKEDAGCDSADVLAHCRGPGPHVRGCWVVDLILGKK